jgi:hypothetical protein
LANAAHPRRADGIDRGTSFHSFGEDELVKLATRLIVAEALEGEAGDALGREYYEHGAQWVSPGTAENGSRADGIFGVPDCRP